MNKIGWTDRLKKKHMHINFPLLMKQVKKRKKKLGKVNEDLQRLRKCSTKKMLSRCLKSMHDSNKGILIAYMRFCFIFDVFTRRVVNRKLLFSKRTFLLECIIEPQNLMKECSFDNNLIKNFCTGAVNFISRFIAELEVLRDNKEIFQMRKLI